MNDHEHPVSSDDLLDIAIRSVRDEPVPEGPSADINRKTLAALRGAAEMKESSRRNWWSMRTVRQSSLAAGLFVLAALGIWWGVFGRGAGVAWGDVVDKLHEVHAVRCKLTTEMTLPGGRPEKSESHVLMTDTGWVISENDAGASKSVSNYSKGAQLMVLNKQKLAIKTEFGKAVPAQAQPSLLAELKKLDRTGEKSLGEKEVEGMHAKGFQVTSAKGVEMEIWVDTKTDRPVLVKAKVSAEAMQSIVPIMTSPVTSTYSEFDWNPQVDPKELTFDAPAGYHLETINAETTSPSTEADVTAMLKTIAELNGGVYTEGVSMTDSFKVLMKWVEAKKVELQKANLLSDATKEETIKQMVPLSLTLSRGWTYMGLAAKGSDWRYAGKGVKAGEKGVPILWYKTPSGTWRVFDADLTVHDAKEADLPKGEAVNRQLTTMPSEGGSPATSEGGVGLP